MSLRSVTPNLGEDRARNNGWTKPKISHAYGGGYKTNDLKLNSFKPGDTKVTYGSFKRFSSNINVNM